MFTCFSDQDDSDGLPPIRGITNDTIEADVKNIKGRKWQVQLPV